jgi:hypothetical protein
MNEIEKEFVPYEQSLALKELGFDEPFSPFDTFYYRNGYLCEANKNAVESFNSFNDEVVLAPLYQQAFRFLRENRHLKFFIKEDDFRESVYEYGIKEVINITGFKTYEQAELECLKELIEIVKNKKD